MMIGCDGRPEALLPDAAIAKGWAEYNEALYDDAERLFASAARGSLPKDDLHLRALYGEACTVSLRRPGGDAERARPLYEEIVRLAPESDWAAWSLLALARMVHLPADGSQPPLAAVVAAYQPVIDRFPFHQAGEEAFAFQQSARVASFDPRENQVALALMERFAADHPDSPFRCHVYLILSGAYRNLHEPAKAVAAMIRFAEIYRVDPKNPSSDFAGIYWSIATLANYQAGDFATARKYYRLLIDEYPTERRVYTAKLALRTMDEVENRLRAGNDHVAPPSPPPL